MAAAGQLKTGRETILFLLAGLLLQALFFGRLFERSFLQAESVPVAWMLLCSLTTLLLGTALWRIALQRDWWSFAEPTPPTSPDDELPTGFPWTRDNLLSPNFLVMTTLLFFVTSLLIGWSVLVTPGEFAGWHLENIAAISWSRFSEILGMFFALLFLVGNGQGWHGIFPGAVFATLSFSLFFGGQGLWECVSLLPLLGILTLYSNRQVEYFGAKEWRTLFWLHGWAICTTPLFVFFMFGESWFLLNRRAHNRLKSFAGPRAVLLGSLLLAVALLPAHLLWQHTHAAIPNPVWPDLLRQTASNFLTLGQWVEGGLGWFLAILGLLGFYRMLRLQSQVMNIYLFAIIPAFFLEMSLRGNDETGLMRFALWPELIQSGQSPFALYYPLFLLFLTAGAIQAGRILTLGFASKETRRRFDETGTLLLHSLVPLLIAALFAWLVREDLLARLGAGAPK